MECPVCHRFFPRVNSFQCCGRLICTECYINDPCCKSCKKDPKLQSLSKKINANQRCYMLYSDMRYRMFFYGPSTGNPKQNIDDIFPDDIMEIAREYNIDEDEVYELIRSGYPIDNIVL